MDKNEFIKNGLIKDNKTLIINGSGVNLDVFKPVLYPTEPAFLFVGRLIRDKGIIEYLEACRIIKQKYPQVRCLLVGPFDTNPSSLKENELKPYIDNEIIEYFGEQKDVRPFITQCSTFVLPSYSEGTPKTVLEAMAMGRSIITCNAPGCRETVINGSNGFLVEVKDIEGIAEKMEYLICNPNVSQEMGLESLKIAEAKYDVRIVNKDIVQAMSL